MTAMLTHDIRTSSPIATRAEVSTLVGVKPGRLTGWTHPTHGRAPLVHTVNRSGHLTIPLVGIAEAAGLAALRHGGLSMQQARKAAEVIRANAGTEYALASPKLLTDGTDAFIEDDRGIWRLRDRQGAIREAFARHLRPLVLDEFGFVRAFHVEEFKESRVTIDPRFNAGRMSFESNRVPVFAVADALEAGESIDAVSDSFGLDRAAIAEVSKLLQWVGKVT